MREELRLEVEVEGLLWELENFFVYRTVPNSEMGLYFLMNLPSGSDLYNAKGVIQTKASWARNSGTVGSHWIR